MVKASKVLAGRESSRNEVALNPNHNTMLTNGSSSGVAHWSFCYQHPILAINTPFMYIRGGFKRTNRT